ncbi:hypothetical protein MD484_g7819, partial [Candolleomyces efflorescens]
MQNKEIVTTRSEGSISEGQSGPPSRWWRIRRSREGASKTGSPLLSFLQNARNFRARDINVTVVNSPAIPEDDGPGWKLLVQNISPNALHNSSARYDPPKCDEGTRVELLQELMTRITNHRSLQRLLCMTGPAGSGKSALQQTIAECCEERDILGSAYFFATADPTRNTVSTIVPTIAFQLGSHDPTLKEAISTVVAQDNVIFARSLRVQMDNLIVRPVRALRKSVGVSTTSLPYAILIDGLDECRGEERQHELLDAIRACLLDDDLPFFVFITSRPEWAIRTALEPGGHLRSVAFHIDLTNYYAGADMRRYLRTRFEKLTSRARDPNWFTENDIQTLVNAGSGQFVYVTTVYKWISEPRGSPAQRLKIVIRWAPQAGQTARPFEALDQLYTNILLNAKIEYEAVDTHYERDFLLLFNIHHTNAVAGLLPGQYAHMSKDQVATCLDLESDSLEILISDLHSLVSLQTRGEHSPNPYLHIHHKSFSDFLNVKSRAKDLFVPRSRVYERLIKCCLSHILRSPKSDFSRVPLNLDDEIIDFTQRGGWKQVDSAPSIFFSRSKYTKLLEDGKTQGIKERDPKVLEEMEMYFEKWKREYDQYLAERKRRFIPAKKGA